MNQRQGPLGDWKFTIQAETLNKNNLYKTETDYVLAPKREKLIMFIHGFGDKDIPNHLSQYFNREFELLIIIL